MIEQITNLQGPSPSQQEGTFITKMRLASKVLPLVEEEPFKSVVYDCFNNPQSRPPVEFSAGHQIKHPEWPTTTDELRSELNGRVIFLTSHLASLREQGEKLLDKKRTQKPKISKKDRDFLKAEIAKRPERKMNLAVLRELSDSFDPRNIPNTEDELTATKSALNFLDNLIKQKAI
ncbi:MAG: hypothetical protein NT162_03380 [Candidatus Woesebacteria bacterium]|nr:hypothetical protein [Candidatus Woesebacteria bacterium]